MLMHRRNSQQGGHRHMVLVHTAVCQNQDVGSVTVSTYPPPRKAARWRCSRLGALIIGNRNLCYLEALHLHILDLQHIGVSQDRIVDLRAT